MIRRAIIVLVLAASMLVGSSAVADAGELCVHLFPKTSSARLCIPTWVAER